MSLCESCAVLFAECTILTKVISTSGTAIVECDRYKRAIIGGPRPTHRQSLLHLADQAEAWAGKLRALAGEDE